MSDSRVMLSLSLTRLFEMCIVSSVYIRDSIALEVLILAMRNVLALPSLLEAQQVTNFDFSVYKLCNGFNDEPPSMLHMSNSNCWYDLYYDFRHCDCGQGFQALSNGKCQRGHCSPGYSAIEDGECVHCPDKSARWCLAMDKCICHKNYKLDVYNRCVPCGENEISNGYDSCRCRPYYSYNIDGTCEKCGENEDRNPLTKRCECRTYYARNQTGHCISCTSGHMEVQFPSDNDRVCGCSDGFRMNANAYCVSKPRRYGILFASVGFAIFSTLGLIFGYVVRQYTNNGYQACTSIPTTGTNN